MSKFNIGDVIVRKSYNADILFSIVDARIQDNQNIVYVLRGLNKRILADAYEKDIEHIDRKEAIRKVAEEIEIDKYIRSIKTMLNSISASRTKSIPGTVLHIDSSREFLDMCSTYYKKARILFAGKVVRESRQPSVIRNLVYQYNPNIVVITGHDGIKKDADPRNMSSYANSRYFVQSVKEARKITSDKEKLVIFAGACQSYYEEIMAAGANFASSPERVLINALDPAITATKIALTSEKTFVSPAEIASIVKSGKKGIWGIETRGQMKIR